MTLDWKFIFPIIELYRFIKWCQEFSVATNLQIWWICIGSSWRPVPIILHHRIQTVSGAPAHTIRKYKKMTRIDTNSGFGRDWDTLWKKSNNGTFIALQVTQKFQILCTGSKMSNRQFLMWHFWPRAWKLKFFVAKYLHLKCYECAIIELFP